MSKYDAVKWQWESLEPAKFNNDPKLSLGQRILDLLSKHGPKVAQINDDTGIQITYNELHLQTVRAAQNLLRMGFEPRQKFSFMVINCDELLPIFLAATCLACPIVPFYESLSTKEIINILRKTKPTAMFCNIDAYQKSIKQSLNELDWKMKVFTFGGRLDDTEPVSNLLKPTGNEHNFVPVQIDVETDVAGIFCSSGTTGPSKAVLLSYGFSTYNSQKTYEPNTKIFDIHPIYWTVGVKIIMESIDNGATRIITAKPLTAQHQLELIEKYKMNVLNPTPGTLIPCLNHERIHDMDLSSVKLIYIYGAKLPLNLIPDIKRHFPNARIYETYGATEVGAASLASLDNAYINSGCHASGHRILPNCVVKIVDDNENRCGPNELGEIRIKMAHKFLGYLNDPVQTANAVDDEGFYRTGDIGQFDDQGFLCITDRKKNIINVFYYESIVLPREIEEHLLKWPDIKEVCVVGIPIVSELHLPAAVVVRMHGSKLSHSDVFNAIADHFPNRAKPCGGVYFMDELPKNHNGKVIHSEVRKFAMQQFRSARNKAEFQSYLADFPEEFREIIFKSDETL